MEKVSIGFSIGFPVSKDDHFGVMENDHQMPQSCKLQTVEAVEGTAQERLQGCDDASKELCKLMTQHGG